MINLLKKSLIIVFISFSSCLFAGEGMWLPLLLESLNEAEMQEMGMKMSAEDIYSVNKGSLKDAIVHFGGFCTGEIISDQGLLLTNHHCGYSNIQSHSTIEDNYLKNGFWAMSNKEELPNPGLFARFIVRIEDVSDKILKGVTDEMTATERQSAIDKNIANVKGGFRLKEFQDVIIRPFFKGNQFFLFITETFNDVRLVGTPPESIGKFGSDTDNWVWPRHTGDFSLFRIYANKDNSPANYSPDNVPYKPKHFLPVSLDGVAEDDFTLVFGFPGRTNQYLPSPAVEQIVDVLNPAKIGIRDAALKILDEEMRKDEKVRLQYASKFARVANYWKKWIGESQGLQATGGIAKKKKLEKEFMNRLANDESLAKKYAHILPRFETLYKEITPYAQTRDYYFEVVGRNVELMRVVSRINRLINAYDSEGEKGYTNSLESTKNYLNGFFKNYRPEIDQNVFAALMEKYHNEVAIKEVTRPLAARLNKGGRNIYQELATALYEKSMLAKSDQLLPLLEKANMEDVIKVLRNDPAVQFGTDMRLEYIDHVADEYQTLNDEISTLQRTYMKGLMEAFPKRRFYPDANSTLRVTYGKVNGYSPKDAVYYKPVTYLDGAIAKYVPGDYEFDIPAKLLELSESKDYGQYADNGKMPICFIGSNHTTGGNSGSPAIDAHGNLIGLNFDRVWEGTMSDINYDASICRNIMVDIRYVLFIVDKFAGAGHLVEEMKLVHPKKTKAGKIQPSRTK